MVSKNPEELLSGQKDKDIIPFTGTSFVWSSLTVITFVHLLASFKHWYWVYSWIDIPMHFVGGLWVALLFFWLMHKVEPQYPADVSLWIVVLTAIGFVMTVGVFWEFFEFSYDTLIAKKGLAELSQQGSADTVGDLAMDLLGGSAFLAYYSISIRKFSLSR